MNADSPHKSFYPPIKETDVSKTDLNPGKAKSYGVDYSLYNYGKRKLKKDSDQIYRPSPKIPPTDHKVHNACLLSWHYAPK